MASDEDRRGPIPTGLWRLNRERSRLLSPKSLTLWIVENGAGGLRWVAVETSAERGTQVISWHGQYGGPAAQCVGAGVEARLTGSPEDGIRTEGEFPGVGCFVETCTLEADGKRMCCVGEVKTANGTQTYIEDFDWAGESPHEA